MKELNRSTRDGFLERLMRLDPASPPRWGTLSAAGMLRHLHRSFEVSLGEVAVPDQSTFLTRTLGKWVVLNLPMRIPRDRIKAPDLFTPPDSGNFETERQMLVEKLDAFLDILEREPQRRVAGFLFGPMTLVEWTRMHAAHWDHHLRQFGV